MEGPVNESQALSVLDKVHVAVYSCNKDGFITGYNQAAAALWGREPEKYKEQWSGAWKMFSPEGTLLPAETSAPAIALRTGTRVEGEEILIQRPDASFRNVQIYSSPVLDDAGNASGAVITLIDITEHKTDETRQALLAAIIESSEDAIVSKTLQGIITSWNQGAEKIFGYKAHEVIGKSIEIIIPDDRRDEESLILSKIRNGEMVYHFQTIRQRKDGVQIPISLTISPVKNKQGRIIGASKIARDISLQTQTERDLYKYSKRLEMLSSIGKLISENLDVQDVLQKVTDATTSLTGAAFGAFFYNTIDERGESYMLFTLSGAPREAFEKFGMPRNTPVFHPTFSGEGIVRVDDITKDPRYGKNPPHSGMPKGHLPVVSYLAVPVILKSGEVIGGLFFGHPEPGMFKQEHEDIVASIASQASAALDNARLFQEVQSLSMKKDEFIALASHEIKTPLTTISGYLQILAMDMHDERSKIFVNKILTQLSKLNGLISNLLDMSRIRAGKLELVTEPIDLKELVAEVIEAQSYTQLNNHELIFENDGQECMVEGDRQRLEQVVVNLLTNAVKYSPKQNQVRIDVTKENGEVSVHVEDQGIGMTPEQQRQVFTQFYRAEGLSSHIPGLGLGLHISKEIIERHQGRIWVESRAGEGSVFSFALPAVKAGTNE